MSRYFDYATQTSYGLSLKNLGSSSMQPSHSLIIVDIKGIRHRGREILPPRPLSRRFQKTRDKQFSEIICRFLILPEVHIISSYHNSGTDRHTKRSSKSCQRSDEAVKISILAEPTHGKGSMHVIWRHLLLE
jgi:hypothetical protein